MSDATQDIPPPDTHPHTHNDIVTHSTDIGNDNGSANGSNNHVNESKKVSPDITDLDDNNPFDHSSLADMIKTEGEGNGVGAVGGPMDTEESVLLFDNKLTNNGGVGDNSSIQINFESRVSKLLTPHSNIKIQITEANNSSEGMSNSSKKYIVYTIKLINMSNPKDEIQIRRRYSDFESLREILTRIFPLIIIPPIPPKNYFNFAILNSFVGKSGNGTTGAANGAKQKESASYSYINSTHLNSNKLIEHRKRLLTNFLNNCLNINQIRNLEFFGKFLDPNTNWQDEINLINNHLPKDIYHSNPENGLKTDAIYSHLPNPSSGPIKMGFLGNLSKKWPNGATGPTGPTGPNGASGTSGTSGNTSNGTVSGASGADTPGSNGDSADDSSEISPKASSELERNDYINTSHLDDINKKIMANFTGLAADYTELGTVFNSFSVLLADAPIIRTAKAKGEEETGRLNMILDKMSQVFDRSYITINSLIGDLETKFSEPLGEEVQYTTSLNIVQKYQSRKLKQNKMLEAELADKKVTLAELMKAEEESTRLEGTVRNDQIAKNTNYQLDQPHSGSYASKFKLSNITSIKKITQYVSDIMDQNPQQTRKQRLSDLKVKITTLEKCRGMMMADITYISDELDKNIKSFHKKQLKVIYDILLYYNGFLVNWARKNLDIWEEIREELVAL